MKANILTLIIYLTILERNQALTTLQYQLGLPVLKKLKSKPSPNLLEPHRSTIFENKSSKRNRQPKLHFDDTNYGTNVPELI